jgi:hypothetical protein
MAKKDLSTDLLAAHMNALEKTLSAVEVQVASVKTLLKLTGSGKASKATEDEVEETEADEEPEEKPARKKRKKAEPEADEESEDESDDEESEDESDDEESEDESDDEESEDESDDEESEDEGKPNKAAVIQALKDYSQKHNRAKALKVLGKFDVKSVHDLKPKQYGALIKALK